MNLTRLLRTGESQRTEYLRVSLDAEPIQTLRHYAAEYGVHNPQEMTKSELISVIVAGLSQWAEMQVMSE